MKDKLNFKLIDDGHAIGAFLDGKQIGEINFARPDDNRIIIDYTGVDGKYAGKGVGGQLVHAVVEMARRDKKRIVPVCSFARAQFMKHPEYNDTLMSSAE